MPIVDPDGWEECQRINDDPYGGCVVNIARRVMEILEEEETPLGPGDAGKMISRADREIKAGGITGFMAGAAAEIVSQTHSRGDEFRKSWNADYGHDGDGVVNPAIVNIDVPEGKTVEEVIGEAAEKAGLRVATEEEKDQLFKNMGLSDPNES